VSSSAIRLALFVVMEASWIGALALFIDALLAAASHPAILWVLAFYPLGLATEYLVGRAPPRVWVRRAIRAIAFCAVAAIAILLAFDPGGRPWDADGFAWFVDVR
jgi:hypothetical protein